MGKNKRVSTVQAQAQDLTKKERPVGQQKKRKEKPLRQEHCQVLGARRHPATRLVLNP